MELRILGFSSISGMAHFYILLILFYIFLLLAMKRSWDKCGLRYSNIALYPSTALLIPFRNEYGNLPALLLNLEQTVPPAVELIFIDDASYDGSYSMIETFLFEKDHPNWHLIKSKGIGKKTALSTAIVSTQAEIIMTTDADCRLPKDWISRMLLPFQQDRVQLVAGPVITDPGKGIFGKFQQIEWASILLLTQFLFSLGIPGICSAANLAYRRSAFIEVGGFLGNEGHLSGDDEFLLKKISQKFGNGSAVYVKEADALVITQSFTSLTAYLQQRIRWASKWKMHTSFPNAYTALLTVFLAVLELGSILLVFGDAWSISAFVVFWVIKISGEKTVLGRVLDEFKIYPQLLSYVFSSFVHPIYVLFIAPLAAMGKFSWKGRKQNGQVILGKVEALSTNQTVS